MYLFAASFLATFSMIVYNDLFGPEQAGISAEYRSGAMVVTEVQPGSSGEQAGLKVNDRVAFVDGQPVHNFADWMGLRTNFEAATPHRLEIGRNDQTLQSTLVLRRQQPFQNWRTTSQQRSPAFRGSQFLILLLAFVIAFNKPHDAVARIGAWFLAALAIFNPAPPFGLTALWRHLPWPIGALLWVAVFSCFLGSPLLFTFFALFPRELFRGRWKWVAAWLPMTLVIPPCTTFWYHAVYTPEHVTGVIPTWSPAVIVGISIAYAVGAVRRSW